MLDNSVGFCYNRYKPRLEKLNRLGKEMRTVLANFVMSVAASIAATAIVEGLHTDTQETPQVRG